MHKAGWIIRKLESFVDHRKLGSSLDESLLRRTNRILNDYTVIYRGFRPSYYVSDTCLSLTVLGALDKLSRNPYDDEAILEALDDEEYLSALKMRIAHVNLFEDVDSDILAGKCLHMVRMDVERFTDALIDILERLVRVEVHKINISSPLRIDI